MKKKEGKKLGLHKLTIAALNRQDMVFVGGGSADCVKQIATDDCSKLPRTCTPGTEICSNNCDGTGHETGGLATESNPRKGCAQ